MRHGVEQPFKAEIDTRTVALALLGETVEALMRLSGYLIDPVVSSSLSMATFMDALSMKPITR